MKYNTLFAAISTAMSLATRLSSTRAFSHHSRSPRLRLLASGRTTKPILPDLAFLRRSYSDSSHSATEAAAAAAAAENVSPTTERMRIESEREMSRLLERLGKDSIIIPTTESSTKAIVTTTCQPATRARIPRLCTTRDQVAAYMKEHDICSILFDCDGVVYRSPDPAPGARACIQSLALDSNKRVYFVTNNAATNRMQLRDKLASILDMNDDDSSVVLTEDVMVPSSFAAAQYLKQQLSSNDKSNSSASPAEATTGRLFVIGSRGLADELRQAGFTIVGSNSGDEDKTSMTRDELASFDFGHLHPIDAVVVGHDTNLHFRKLAMAQVLLQRNPDALLVATNIDAFDLVGANGYEIPGNGGAVKFLEWTSRRTAVNCGKPSPILATVLQDLYGLDTSRALFVGDRLDTDIQFGIDTGMHTALVLTGVTTGHQMADILVQQHQDGSSVKGNHAIPSIILPHIGLLA